MSSKQHETETGVVTAEIPESFYWTPTSITSPKTWTVNAMSCFSLIRCQWCTCYCTSINYLKVSFPKQKHTKIYTRMQVNIAYVMHIRYISNIQSNRKLTPKHNFHIFPVYMLGSSKIPLLKSSDSASLSFWSPWSSLPSSTSSCHWAWIFLQSFCSANHGRVPERTETQSLKWHQRQKPALQTFQRILLRTKFEEELYRPCAVLVYCIETDEERRAARATNSNPCRTTAFWSKWSKI